MDLLRCDELDLVFPECLELSNLGFAELAFKTHRTRLSTMKKTRLITDSLCLICSFPLFVILDLILF